jgi:hypothetical protein
VSNTIKITYSGNGHWSVKRDDSVSINEKIGYIWNDIYGNYYIVIEYGGRRCLIARDFDEAINCLQNEFRLTDFSILYQPCGKQEYVNVTNNDIKGRPCLNNDIRFLETVIEELNTVGQSAIKIIDKIKRRLETLQSLNDYKHIVVLKYNQYSAAILFNSANIGNVNAQVATNKDLLEFHVQLRTAGVPYIDVIPSNSNTNLKDNLDVITNYIKSKITNCEISLIEA